MVPTQLPPLNSNATREQLLLQASASTVMGKSHMTVAPPSGNAKPEIMFVSSSHPPNH